MKLKIAICDDDPTENEQLTSYLQQFDFEYDVDIEITAFTSSDALLKNYKESGTFNIVFLDVEMPGLNGLEVAHRLRSLPDRNLKIVFVSNFPKYMQASFDVQAFQYLQKPIQYPILKTQLIRIIEDFQQTQSVRLLVQTDETEELVLVDNIVCIETVKYAKNQLSFLMNDRTILAKGTLLDLEKELSQYSFISPKRGILINMAYIHYFKENMLVMTNGLEIPMSRRKEKEVRLLFSKHILTIHHSN